MTFTTWKKNTGLHVKIQFLHHQHKKATGIITSTQDEFEA